MPTTDHPARGAPSAGPVPAGIAARRRTITTALLIVLALLLGGAGGFALARSGGSPGEDSAEAGFARDMSTHHAQAVSMAGTLYRDTSDRQLSMIAYDIITSQQAQIGIMNTWLDTWGLGPNSKNPPMAWMGHGAMTGMNGMGGADGLMPGMATTAELTKLRGLRGRDQDVLFCQLMIRHPRGGVGMAKGVVDRTDDRQVRHLAEGIRAAQLAEIDLLNEELTRLGAAPVR
jgi:uncharacterized protein (DUF305 family)